MARDLYCWRCDMVIPMLEEHEWRIVRPLANDAIGDIRSHRLQHGGSLEEAKHALGLRALEKYRELTGFHETNVNALWHHRVELYGAPCAHCGKPLRTPAARACAACGEART